MPTITINGTPADFSQGEKILQIANRVGEDIPYYCYHDGLSIPAQCRICLAEIWAPNPRNDNKIEPMMGGKLQPTCSTDAADGMIVYTKSPKAVANQKAVMEYLLINHPLDCPVCDQAGECELQDYSYKHGRGVSRFQEQKVKQPKKDLGPHVYIYADRCIMCTRCVRFAREWPETAEIMIDGRGNKSQIDVFPGVPLDNELSANVIDICPVGALLDKDFLFTQRVWFLKSSPSIDGITASGDNIHIEHNEGKVYRLKPRHNMDINKWWITDEVRYGWKFVHSDDRIAEPLRRQHGILVETDWARAYDQAIDTLREPLANNTGGNTNDSTDDDKRLALVISPMLPCEEAYALASLARQIDPSAILALGPVPRQGEDKHFPPSYDPDDPRVFKMRAEKAPNARGVRRVLEAITGNTALEFDDLLANHTHEIAAVLLTGNYPSNWATDRVLDALESPAVVLIDTLDSDLRQVASVILPGATWTEKAGTFENADARLQAFEQAIPTQHFAKSEGQIATDMLAILAGGELDTPAPTGKDIYGGVAVVDDGPGQVPASTDAQLMPRAELFNAADTRADMAAAHPDLVAFTTEIHLPASTAKQQADVELVEL